MNRVLKLQRIDKSTLVGLAAFEGGSVHEELVRRAMAFRVQIIKQLTSSEVAQVANYMGGKLVDCKIDEATAWTLELSPFARFGIYYFLQRYAPEFKDNIHVMYSKEALEIGLPGEDVATLTILFANAIVYCARKTLGRELPRISRYL